MRILSIETSCDETAVSVIEAEGSIQNPSYTVISSSLFSQSDMHALYGGVLPNLARRAHAEKIIPLVVQTLEKANALHTETQVAVENSQHENKLHEVEAILEKEPVVFDSVQMYELETRIPAIDAVAVTEGPGLEPALWVGISTARALAHLWNKPLIPTNHMEGHILSPLITKQPAPVTFPALAVLISGGHTELVHVHSFGSYHIIGKTRDDAIGEAFDKVARLLDLPYPGGPQVSALAQAARDEHIIPKNHGITLPRPMIQSKDMDFSFSGLKTAVLYLIRSLTKNTTVPLSDIQKKAIAREFEDAVIDVLYTKIETACNLQPYTSILVGGGVIANTRIREAMLSFNNTDRTVFIPDTALSTDNAVMIGMAAYIRHLQGKTIPGEQVLCTDIRAHGNLSYTT